MNTEINTEIVSDTPMMDDAWDAFDRRAAGLAYVRHQSRTLERELREYRVKCHAAIQQAAVQSAELAEWKACADKLVKYLFDTSSVGEFDRCRAVKITGSFNLPRARLIQCRKMVKSLHLEFRARVCFPPRTPSDGVAGCLL